MFPGGRPLELARRFAIYSCALLFIAACMAGMVFWAGRSRRVSPHFIFISESGEWTVYSGNDHQPESPMPAYRLMQESIAVKYAADYFRITGDPAGNAEVLWCKCSDQSCAVNWNKCKICCAGDQKAFGDFATNVEPEWRKIFAAGGTMELAGITARPAGEIDENSGFWEIKGELVSRKKRRVTAFVRIGRSRNEHRQTLGFHVSEFDFYIDE
jgi:hypothetical protein